jgi:hypothetical protein
MFEDADIYSFLVSDKENIVLGLKSVDCRNLIHSALWDSIDENTCYRRSGFYWQSSL